MSTIRIVMLAAPLLCLLSSVATGRAPAAQSPATQNPATQNEVRQPAEVMLEAIEVLPAQPAAETLCQLRLTLRNRGKHAVYAFAFDVQLNGVPLAVYDRQLFLRPIAPGEQAELRLFNFWTTESGRARPADGKLQIRVALQEAKWLEITTESGTEGKEDVEVWRPLDPVEGLPVIIEKTLELR